MKLQIKLSKAKLDSEKKGIILKMKELDKKGERIEKSLKILTKEFDDLMLQVPNIPFDDVPVGKDDTGNVVMKRSWRKAEI